ncbi:MAG: ABC transporter permease [Planctomycetes bacterium]|nr:ABC transporter permease [Planctomycetota bacterium]
MMRRLPFDYAVRNLGRSPTRLLLTLAGSVLVVSLVIAASAFIRGMTVSLAITGNPHNAMIVSAGSEESIERSQIDRRAAGIAAASINGIRERLGVPYVSPEVHLALAVKVEPSEPKGRLTVVRGVDPVAWLVHPQAHLVEGRAAESGQDEIMVGSLVAEKLGVPDARLAVGRSLIIDGRPWMIAGRLSAPRTVMDAEIWMPLGDLQVVAQRDSLSCVILTLDPASGAEVADVQAFAAQRLDLEITALAESDYYRSLVDFFAPIRIMVLVTAGLIGLGGLFGGLNTLYAAFASRVREIGTLQTLGYRRGAVVLSLLQESLVASSAGALVAAALCWWLLDGVAVRFSMGAFGLIVDGPVLLTGIAAGLGLGIVGALPPSIRCLRLPIAEALKA